MAGVTLLPYFVKESRFARVSHPRAPALSLYFFQIAYFVKELRRKNLHGRADKIFRALDNDDKLKSHHARSGFPPRALITKTLSTTHSLSHACTPYHIFCKCLLPSFVCTSTYLIYPLVDVPFFAPLDKGANGSLCFICSLWGYEEFWGSQGDTRKILPGRFRFLLRPKGRLNPQLENLKPVLLFQICVPHGNETGRCRA